ncbi:MAG: CoA transferase [Dehalococcoidia bacterium]|nr:CoA transferase [Dehalococcoidia bacterium]
MLSMSEGLLSDLLVVELGRDVAGPYCGKILAGCGAEVIKIEPLAGDPARSAGPFKDDDPHPEKSGRFLHLNGGKKSITLDLEAASGRGLFKRLLAQADILIDNLGYGVLAGMGLEYAAIAAANPGLIIVAITYYGQDGPYRAFAASELTAYSMSGYQYLTGDPDREPVRPNFALAQYQGGAQAATGAMAALMARDAMDIGQLVDVSIVEATCFSHGSLSAGLNLGMVYRRAGSRNLNFHPKFQYPSVTLPCKDGYVHVHFAPADPQLLAVLMEEPKLGAPELWDTPMGHADDFDALCLPWLARYDKREVVQRAQELRHPFTEVLTVGELFDDEQFKARGMFVGVEHPVVGTVTQVGPPIRSTETEWRVARAPLLGEHNDEIYCGRLGLSREELVILSENKVI